MKQADLDRLSAMLARAQGDCVPLPEPDDACVPPPVIDRCQQGNGLMRDRLHMLDDIVERLERLI